MLWKLKYCEVLRIHSKKHITILFSILLSLTFFIPFSARKPGLRWVPWHFKLCSYLMNIQVYPLYHVENCLHSPNVHALILSFLSFVCLFLMFILYQGKIKLLTSIGKFSLVGHICFINVVDWVICMFDVQW